MLYYEKPYMKRAEVEVLDREGNKYLLSDTILYPGGGGQPPDRGAAICNGERYRIEHVGNGWHVIDGDCGGRIEIELDWEFRYYMMKSHTAEHAFFRFLQNLGARLGKAIFGDVSTLSFTGDVTIEDVLDAEEGVRKLIERNVEVETFWIDKGDVSSYSGLRIKMERIRDERIRLVRIGAHDLTACKGIHVKNMGEIGDFAVVGYRGGSKKEVKFVVDYRASEFHHLQSRKLRDFAWNHGIEIEKVGQYMANQISENQSMRRAMKDISASAPFVREGCTHILYSLVLPNGDRKTVVRRMMELTNSENATVIYIDPVKNAVMCTFPDDRAFVKARFMELLSEMGGRGGGSGNFVSGSVSDVNEFREKLKNILCS